MTRAVPVDRISAGDLMQLASDVGPVPMNVGAVLILERGPGTDLSAVEAALRDRVQAIPRFRQRLLQVPWWCGRPIWVDDAGFDVSHHVEHVRCAAPGDRRVLLEAAVEAVTRPLPRSRPLWRAVFVAGLDGDRDALVLVLHHVLADGIGGLAVLSRLVDGAEPAPVAPGRPCPSRGLLFRDAALARARALGALPAAVRRTGAAAGELGSGRPELAPACSLNRPTGPRRGLATAEVSLAAVQTVARRHRATVNDVLLVAATRALEETLRARGETVPALVMSVPVAARRATTTAVLGNAVGVMPVRVPLAEPSLDRRLEAVAAVTRRQKGRTRGASAAFVGPAFRVLARFGVLRGFVNRQRLVNSFLTNLPGPPEALNVGGARIGTVIPVTVTAGNVCVAFAALSYAGTLLVTVIVDPDRVPELPDLAIRLSDAVRALTQQ